MNSRNTDKVEGQLQIHLTTKQKQFAVPDIPYSIPANVSVQDLNTLLNTLLKENGVINNNFEFDFLVKGEFLKFTMGKHLKDREISFEDVIEIEYVERYPAPEPQDCLIHDDWVSAIKTNEKYILTGCYDNSINVWTLKGDHKLTVVGHEAPIKGVAWIRMNEDVAVFASASKDQTIMIWEWDYKNKAECVFVCKGHERAIDCIDVSPDGTRLASGSWDNLLKVWSALPYNSEGESSSQKKMRSEEPSTRTPLMTLEGHREAISAVQWIDDATILTSSWDHTLKFWDLNLNGITKEIPGNKSFFDFNYSPLNGLIITASADKNLKLYDPRATQGSLIKSTFLGHTQWVQSVRWSKTEEFLFISGAYDNQVKLWDYRSPKAPLFDLMGHEDKVLAVDWTNPKFMVSGGSDNSLRIFKSKKVIEE